MDRRQKMPSVKYSFILSNEQGYEGLAEELKVTAEMDIPDGYNDNELKRVVNEIQVELPYKWYQNVIATVNEVQVREKAVDVFDVKGDNIGKEQKRYIKRVYEKIAADVMMERSKTPVNNPEEKIRFEKVFDGVKNTLSNLIEILFGWLDGFQTKTNRWKERLRKERMEKQRLEEEELKNEDEKTFIATELQIEEEIFEKELLLEKEKIKRIKAEERLEKTKLARLKKEADTQKMKKEFIKLDSRIKELETENKELKTQIAGNEVKFKQTNAIVNKMMEKLKAEANQQYDPQQYYGR